MRLLMILMSLAIFGAIFYNRHLILASRTPSIPIPPSPPALERKPAPVLSQVELNRILAATQDMDANVRWEAAKFLSKAHIAQADGVLFSMLLRDPEASVRKQMIALLSSRHDPEVSRHLAAALKDENPEVRVEALQAFAKIGNYAHTDAISEALSDVDERVRLQALTTLNALQQRKSEDFRKEMEREAVLEKKGEAGPERR